MFNLPITTAPAALSRRTTSASSLGKRCSYTALAAVVRAPVTSIESLIPIGMPCSGPRMCPAACSSSRVLACARALSRITVIQAPILGL